MVVCPGRGTLKEHEDEGSGVNSKTEWNRNWIRERVNTSCTTSNQPSTWSDPKSLCVPGLARPQVSEDKRPVCYRQDLVTVSNNSQRTRIESNRIFRFQKCPCLVAEHTGKPIGRARSTS